MSAEKLCTREGCGHETLASLSSLLRSAANGMLDMYASLVNSGDAGFWDPEEVPEVIALRASLPSTDPRP